MKKCSPWFFCKSQPPVHNGEYEVQLRVSGFDDDYTDTFRALFDDGRWYDKLSGERLTSLARPGWHRKDRWRGLAEKSVAAR